MNKLKMVMAGAVLAGAVALPAWAYQTRLFTGLAYAQRTAANTYGTPIATKIAGLASRRTSFGEKGRAYLWSAAGTASANPTLDVSVDGCFSAVMGASAQASDCYPLVSFTQVTTSASSQSVAFSDAPDYIRVHGKIGGTAATFSYGVKIELSETNK